MAKNLYTSDKLDTILKEARDCGCQDHDGIMISVGLLRGMADELTRLREVERCAQAYAKVVVPNDDPWNFDSEGSVSFCRFCSSPDYRPHAASCSWVAENKIRQALVEALKGA